MTTDTDRKIKSELETELLLKEALELEHSEQSKKDRRRKIRETRESLQPETLEAISNEARVLAMIKFKDEGRDVSNSLSSWLYSSYREQFIDDLIAKRYFYE